MSYLFLALSVVVFMVGIKLLGVVTRVHKVIVLSRCAVSTMRAAQLSEDEKEIEIQRAAVEMSKSCISILVRVFLILAVPYALILFGEFLGFYNHEQLVSAATNWMFITVSSIAMVVALVVLK